ncbi:hypothetical protein E8E15_006112 [Penicillium rubens]|jgi:hypothetical protein|uniref:uncharacterized protein n=1 Tax=Penicillium rubens TaxID=1108849 RepID=UPI001DF3C9D0|nr:uncharacterized protein N7525_006231 [Penicillium rubens]KAF3016665.1 hypothetical protein E8E15_006112 [Penicillium rubens]KAJ5050256.1 hypothetical protein NUH16_008796 [Penicillium rubens]KAJ5827978.1 hypothetical protein N7525_006231 [Penicillium rubens]KAJ5849103.1 hypothetical protein N7534_007792 [Penicillium rubens]
METNASSGLGSLPRQVARQIRQQNQTRGRPTTRSGVSNAQDSNSQTVSYRSPIRPGMGSSRFATIPNEAEATYEPDPMELDPMEIDTPEQEPAPASTGTRNEQSEESGIHRHIFYIPIRSRPMPTLDLDVLTAARAEVARIQRAGIPVLQTLPERPGPHLYIRIDTDQASRDHALADANLRMGIMQDMIRDGLGWFTGLPYRHPHFEVKFLRGRRL